jgi:hypothetical protein
MLDRFAWYFFILAQLLERLHHELGVSLAVSFPPTSGNASVINALGALPGGAASLGIVSQLPRPAPTPTNTLSDAQKTRLIGLLDLVEQLCTQISVTRISNDVNRAKDYMQRAYPERERVIFYIENISNRVIDEIKEEKFLHIENYKLRHYQNIELVDNTIGKKLPNAAQDLYHAGSCFALEQYTACVFHLMRVMEYCVQRLGKKLRMPIDVSKETWAQIMDHVNNAIKAMRGGKGATAPRNRKKQRYSLAASRLDRCASYGEMKRCTQSPLMTKKKQRTFWMESLYF